MQSANTRQDTAGREHPRPSSLRQRRDSATLADMSEVVFIVRPEVDGGFSASWDAPGGGGISTQGNDLAELEAMIRDAVLCHFEEGEAPASVRLHFEQDPALVLA